jgi:hypothetical protein
VGAVVQVADHRRVPLDLAREDPLGRKVTVSRLG